MSSNTPTERKSTYHHGNLRESLLAEALAFLESESLEGLSLRTLAKRVGVSPTAVYSHFADKVELIIDVRTRGFTMLSEYLSAALAREPDASGERRVYLLGIAYMHFAQEKSNLFDTLFSWTPDFERIKPECIEAGVDSVEILREAIIDMLHENGLPATDYPASVSSLSSWSLIHGLTMLVKTGSIEGAVFCGHWSSDFSEQSPKTQQRVFDHLLTIEIEGIKAAAHKLTP
ncbi:TetR/AcrR family transcriptional regulator [Gilvimarinus sp. 1_MG-2023]|uniref:TetR/AcrR family transcriptional regulator n=1 Tax=Gilvimarinus sp. 1_MG-2023 TaxID=3062638 RepID=UPI0026E31E35|nr:TetR/AcrR family transcriptional regulator [Gilvimarinus sp. 1_MG-2023]MDO6747059.1 TetR/AcrR family transcriptional regulator [Gilvimarinus sp. 1_MG-2023]